MNPQHLFVDERFTGMCVYCGRRPNTRDHVPSRVLLDEPYPAELPVVEACNECNAGFSKDEVYLACVLDCAIAGSADPEMVTRSKIKRILKDESLLRERIARGAKKSSDGGLVWNIDVDRVRNVILKLARGHAAFELSLPQLDEPATCSMMPFPTMPEDQRAVFENPERGRLSMWPEVGSRAFIRACKGGVDVNASTWITIQPGRYRFMVDQIGGLRVQIVLSEYLACRICWD